MTEQPPLNINVNATPEEAERIEREERSFDGKKLVILTVVTLAIAVASLYSMANVWYWLHKI